MRAFALVILFAAVAHAEPRAATPPRWKPLMPPSEKRRLAGVCATGDELLAVGERAFRSHDGGATWPGDGVVLAGEPGYVAGAFALFCRGSSAWAVGVRGQIWRSDGDAWTRLTTPTKETLHAIDGDDELILAVGEGGTLLAARDGTHFTVEKRGGSVVYGAVAVLAGGRAFALGSDGGLLTRAPGGGWHRRMLGAPGDPLVAIARDGRGGLRIVASSGRRWRSADELGRWQAESELVVGARQSCGAFALAGAQSLWLCRRATGNPLAMDPPMEEVLLVSDDDGAHVRIEPPEPGLGRLWSTPSGPIYGVGTNVWRRESSAAPTP